MLASALTAISTVFHLIEFDPEEIFIPPTWWTTVLAIAMVFPIA